MDIPIIDTTTSVLANPQWHRWAHQFAATGTPTIWTVASGGFPPGMVFDAARGYLEGAAVLPGVFSVRLTASNAMGTSAEQLFTIGIGAGAPRSDATVELNMDVDTGAVSRRRSSTSAAAVESAGPIGAMKRGDDVLYRIFPVKGQTPVALDVVGMRMGFEQNEPDDLVLLSSPGFVKEGEGTEATYVLHVAATAAALDAALGEVEDDEGTLFSARAEIELEVRNPLWSTPASLQTALAGADNDLLFVAVPYGAAGDAVSVAYVDPAAANAPLQVVLDGQAITVRLATNGAGAITTTADDIAGVIAASGAASALVQVGLPPGASGSGVVTAMPAEHLSGGGDGIGPEIRVISSRTFRVLIERDTLNP
jgi:hypothetical protein